MPAADFLDTNVLVYFARRGTRHAERAAELVEAGGVINVQVLNEFTNVARGKMKLNWEDTSEALYLLRSLLEVRPLSLEVHDRGLAVAEFYRLHICDAMVVAAALQAGCSTLWSEDMQHGQVIEGRLRIVNPFA